MVYCSILANDKGAVDGLMNLMNMLSGGGRARGLGTNETGWNKTAMDTVVDTILPDFVKDAIPKRSQEENPDGINRLLNMAADRNPLANIALPFYQRAYGAVGDLGSSVFQSAKSFWGDTPTMGNSSGKTLPREVVTQTPLQLQIDGQTLSTVVVESSTFRQGVKLVNSETN